TWRYQPVAGKPVLDTINCIPERDERQPELYVGSCRAAKCSSGTWVRRTWWKAFNNVTFWHLASLARSAGAPACSALPIAPDDPSPKAALPGSSTQSGTTLWTPLRSAPVAASSSLVPARSPHRTGG